MWNTEVCPFFLRPVFISCWFSHWIFPLSWSWLLSLSRRSTEDGSHVRVQVLSCGSAAAVRLLLGRRWGRTTGERSGDGSAGRRLVISQHLLTNVEKKCTLSVLCHHQNTNRLIYTYEAGCLLHIHKDAVRRLNSEFIYACAELSSTFVHCVEYYFISLRWWCTLSTKLHSLQWWTFVPQSLILTGLREHGTIRNGVTDKSQRHTKSCSLCLMCFSFLLWSHAGPAGRYVISPDNQSWCTCMLSMWLLYLYTTSSCVLLCLCREGLRGPFCLRAAGESQQ